MKKLILATAMFSCLSILSFGNGFKSSLQGQKQIGMGGIGIGMPMDAATLYYNPAGLSFIKDQITLGVSAIFPRTQFLETQTNLLTTSENQILTPPSFFAAYHIKNSPISVGIGVYTPFGSSVKYPDNWSGQYILTNISLVNFNIQPTVSVRVTDKFSLGAAMMYSFGSVVLEKNIPLQSQGNDPGHAKLDGNANGIGYSFAAFVQADKQLSFGATYHSRIDMKVDGGTASFTNIPTALQSSFPNTTFDSELPLPSDLGVGVGYIINNRWRMGLDIDYTFWSAYKELLFDYADNTNLLTDAPSARNYENAWTFRFGAQFEANNRLSLRGGIVYDQTPVQDEFVTPDGPDNDRLGLATGFSYNLDKKFSIDGSLNYTLVTERTVVNTETQLEGAYKTKAMVAGLGVQYLIGKKNVNKIKTF